MEFAAPQIHPEGGYSNPGGVGPFRSAAAYFTVLTLHYIHPTEGFNPSSLPHCLSGQRAAIQDSHYWPPPTSQQCHTQGWGWSRLSCSQEHKQAQGTESTESTPSPRSFHSEEFSTSGVWEASPDSSASSSGLVEPRQFSHWVRTQQETAPPQSMGPRLRPRPTTALGNSQPSEPGRPRQRALSASALPHSAWLPPWSWRCRRPSTSGAWRTCGTRRVPGTSQRHIGWHRGTVAAQRLSVLSHVATPCAGLSRGRSCPEV